MKIALTTFLSLAALAGCATVPPDLQGDFARATPNDATTPSVLGENVRWGGRVVRPRTVADASCVEVSTYDISRESGAPSYDTIGRPPSPFLACGGPSAGDDEFDGSLVTFIGAIGTPVVFDVPKAQCSVIRGPDINHMKQGPYVGAKYTLHGDLCTVSLPRLQIASARVWPESQKSIVLGTPQTTPDFYSTSPRAH